MCFFSSRLSEVAFVNLLFCYLFVTTALVVLLHGTLLSLLNFTKFFLPKQQCCVIFYCADVLAAVNIILKCTFYVEKLTFIL